MFGFDLISILAAATGGALGGGLGALLAHLLKAPQWRAALIAGFVAAGAVLGNILAKPDLDTPASAPVRADQFDAIYDREVLPEIKKIAALARIFREHPEVEARFRAKTKEIYDAGGRTALAEQSTSIGALVLGDAFASYMPRARAEDLILFAVTMADVLKAFYDSDPEACIFYQFGAAYGKALSPQRLREAIGEERQRKQIEIMNAVVINAADQPIPFDDAKASAAVAEVSARHTPLLTGNAPEVAQGKRPPADAAEAKVACSFALALFTDLATMDRETAELILRKMFSAKS
jgi:hypothetical protein